MSVHYSKTELNKVMRGSNRATYNVEEINGILDAGFIGHVCYTFHGKAISIPMAYCRVEDKIYLHGSLKNRMLLSLLEASEASMTVMHLDGLVLAKSAFHHSVNYRSATLFCSVSKVIDSVLKKKVLKKTINHMVPDRWESLRPMTDKEFNATLVLELSIDTASAKVRAEGALDEKSDEMLPIWAGIVPIKQVALLPVSDKKLPDVVKIPNHITTYYEENKLQ